MVQNALMEETLLLWVIQDGPSQLCQAIVNIAETVGMIRYRFEYSLTALSAKEMGDVGHNLSMFISIDCLNGSRSENPIFPTSSNVDE